MKSLIDFEVQKQQQHRKKKSLIDESRAEKKTETKSSGNSGKRKNAVKTITPTKKKTHSLEKSRK